MDTIQATLKRLNLTDHPASVWIGEKASATSGGVLISRSPIDGSTLATFAKATLNDLPPVLAAACDAFLQWRIVPAPRRGEFVRRFGNRVRELKTELATLISWEVGKIT